MAAVSEFAIETEETIIRTLADTSPGLARLVAAVLENPDLPNENFYRAALTVEIALSGVN